MKKEKIVIREARKEDIEGIIELEISRYHTLHQELGTDMAQLSHRFAVRIANLKNWYMVALTKNNKVIGAISAIPTNSQPKDFVSWESTTDNGTCSTYDGNDNKNNLYVVNLDVKKEYTRKNVQYMLMSKLGTKAIYSGFKIIYFESRIPGFRVWLEKSGLINNWENYSRSEKHKLASQYINLRDPKGNHIDPLVKFYCKNGFRINHIVPHAFKDPESMNYGVIFYAHNPFASKSQGLNHIASFFFKHISRYPKIVSKII